MIVYVLGIIRFVHIDQGGDWGVFHHVPNGAALSRTGGIVDNDSGEEKANCRG